MRCEENGEGKWREGKMERSWEGTEDHFARGMHWPLLMRLKIAGKQTMKGLARRCQREVMGDVQYAV